MKKFLLLALTFCSIYVQLGAQCVPKLLNCNQLNKVCDYASNNSDLWNQIYWWDPFNLVHDLAESATDINLPVLDTCTGNSLSIRCLLFLDLDRDGLQETVVDSDSFPAAGTVNYNNAFNPNYSGGTSRVFDGRPLPNNFKWHFAIKTVELGDSINYSLQWASEIAPDLFLTPELPNGNHKVRWILTNSDGFSQTCERDVSVKDCKPPVVVCLNGLSANVLPTQMITLWASDFLQYTVDNTSPTNLIKLGIRKEGTGTGFPVDALGNPVSQVSFDCSELGTHAVELWVIDVEGNADYCVTNAIIEDNLDFCGDPQSAIQACAKTACSNGDYLEETAFDFAIHSPNVPPYNYFELGGCASLNLPLPANTEILITPNNDGNPLNGVTTFDMVMLQQILDGLDEFDSPYAWIAADANNDKVVDSLDIVECKNLILGIYTDLPNSSSWRFIDKNHVFPSPNPLSAPFPESILVNSSNLPAEDPEFVAVKMCDITCLNLVGFYEQAADKQSQIGTPEPNPTAQNSFIPLQLLRAASLRLEVSDFTGRLIFRNELNLPEGPALLEIPASSMPQAGGYIWRIRLDSEEKTGKIIRF